MHIGRLGAFFNHEFGGGVKLVERESAKSGAKTGRGARKDQGIERDSKSTADALPLACDLGCVIDMRDRNV